MTKRLRYGDYSPEYLIRFYRRLPQVVWSMSRLVRLINRLPREILELADEFGFEYNPEHPEFTSEQAIVMILRFYDLDEDVLKDLGIIVPQYQECRIEPREIARQVGMPGIWGVHRVQTAAMNLGLWRGTYTRQEARAITKELERNA